MLSDEKECFCLYNIVSDFGLCLYLYVFFPSTLPSFLFVYHYFKEREKGRAWGWGVGELGKDLGGAERGETLSKYIV